MAELLDRPSLDDKTTKEQINKEVISYNKKLGRLNLLTGLRAAQDMKKKQDQQNKNIDAENAAVRDWVWKEGAKNMSGKEEEDMGDNISLGDKQETHTHYHNETPSQKTSSLGKTLAGLGIAAAGLGVGATAPFIAYDYLKGDPAPVEFTDTDTNTKYDLQIYRE